MEQKETNIDDFRELDKKRKIEFEKEFNAICEKYSLTLSANIIVTQDGRLASQICVVSKT